MKKCKSVLCTAALFCALCSMPAFSQISDLTINRANSYGVGVSFGGNVPQTDINEHKVFPSAHAFFRYYPASQAAIEVGFGLASLQADDGTRFFSSAVYPVDIRLLVSPIPSGKFDPYAFAGIGLMSFNPVDQSDAELPRNANK